MRQMRLLFLLAAFVGPTGAATAQPSLDASVEELRHVVGRWRVTTTFIGDGGRESAQVEGTYTFAWVVPDRVLQGRSEIPALGQASALLFYVSQAREVIEMASVGPDGQLWIMTGPLGGATRLSRPVTLEDGTRLQLRFTRSAVTRDRFESRMERSTDDGRTWQPGNRQVFERVRADAGEPPPASV